MDCQDLSGMMGARLNLLGLVGFLGFFFFASVRVYHVVFGFALRIQDCDTYTQIGILLITVPQSSSNLFHMMAGRR